VYGAELKFRLYSVELNGVGCRADRAAARLGSSLLGALEALGGALGPLDQGLGLQGHLANKK
jgi:hypothetical protein